MSETIRVKKSIYDILVRIAREQGMSAEKVLEELVLEKAGIPRDMFGIDRDRVKPYTEKDRMEDRG
ncbi:MAG: hypothetical protein GSR80_001512 [Desulfurococcales archaeon]|nr:hypothetical protein [Desulfurococcales archaeon]